MTNRNEKSNRNKKWLYTMDDTVEQNLWHGPRDQKVTWEFIMRTIKTSTEAHEKLRGFPKCHTK